MYESSSETQTLIAKSFIIAFYAAAIIGTLSHGLLEFKEAVWAATITFLFTVTLYPVIQRKVRE